MQIGNEERFIEVVKTLDSLAEIISYANSECARVEAVNRRLRSHAARDRSPGPSYRDFLGRFLHYVQWDHTAGSTSSSETEIFQSVIEGLNRKKKAKSNAPNEDKSK